MNVRATVVLSVIGAALAVVAGLLLLEGPILAHNQAVHHEAILSQALADVIDGLEAGEVPDEVADRVGAAHGVHITVIGHGVLVGDTAQSGVRLALAGEPESPPDGQPSMQRTNGNTTIRAVLRLPSTDPTEKSLRELIGAAAIFAAIAALLLAVVLSRSIITPVQNLTRVANAYAEGDFSRPSDMTRRDEIGDLGRSIDRMAKDLEHRVTTKEAERDRLQIMLDSMVEGVFVTDREGVITLTNAALEELLPHPALGRTVVEAFRNEDLRASVAEARRGSPSEVEFQLAKENEQRGLVAVVAPLREERGVVVVLHDVTALRRTERVRRDFVANASHELRTPLTAVRGFTETLLDGALSDEVSATQFLTTILKHTKRLQRLVDDLLSLSRSESADLQVPLAPVNAEAVVREVAEGLEGQAKAKNIDIHVAVETPQLLVLANDDALDQVLLNLLENAVKYTPNGGAVSLAVTKSEGRVCVDVSDSGPGLEPKHRARIFERFYRVDKGRSRETGGTGLGLAIVKHLCERMGGEVSVLEVDRPGTTFRVSLPEA